jgi:hypothetical protein
MASIAERNTLFEIDRELDALLDEIAQQVDSKSPPSEDLLARFYGFFEAQAEKVDRIGRFVRMMEAREQFCRTEAARLSDRARAASNKAEGTKNMVLYYLLSRGLKKIEGQQFTLRAQPNCQDSLRVPDQRVLPKRYLWIEARIAGDVWDRVISSLPDDLAKILALSVRDTRTNHDGIKESHAHGQVVTGAEIHRGWHLRVT